MTHRVLFLSHSGTVGGAELMLLDIARAYRDTSAVVMLARGPFVTLLESAGVRVRVLEAGPRVHAVRRETALPPIAATLAIAQVARRVAAVAAGYDVVYANSQKAFVIACIAGAIAKRPVLWHLHDILSSEHFSAINVRVDVMLANHCARRVIAVSEAAAAAFVSRGGVTSKVRVVRNGIESAPFVSPAASPSIRRELGIGDAPLLGCFSRLIPWKGQHVLLDALAALPTVHAIFAGGAARADETYVGELRSRATALGVTARAHFLGPRTDVPRLMREVDVVVHPSVAAEPCARTVIEALFAGKALVASRNGGTTEMVHSGYTGVLFAPGDAHELARHVSALLSRPEECAALGAAGQRYAMENLTVESFLDGVRQQIDEVASETVMSA